MVNVGIKRNKEKKIVAFLCEGHAGYSRKRDEKDMVCAAVSAVIYTALGYMEEYFGMEDFSERDGYISWELPENTGGNIDGIFTVLDAMAVGLKQMEMQYDRYIRVVDEEV